MCDCSSTIQAEQEKQQHYKVTTILMNKKISQFIYINPFIVVFVVTMSFCSFSYVIVDAQ